jgi:hypothetical protein
LIGKRKQAVCINDKGQLSLLIVNWQMIETQIKKLFDISIFVVLEAAFQHGQSVTLCTVYLTIQAVLELFAPSVYYI